MPIYGIIGQYAAFMATKPCLGVILTSYEFFMDILQSEVYFNVVQLLFSQFCVES